MERLNVIRCELLTSDFLNFRSSWVFEVSFFSASSNSNADEIGSNDSKSSSFNDGACCCRDLRMSSRMLESSLKTCFDNKRKLFSIVFCRSRLCCWFDLMTWFKVFLNSARMSCTWSGSLLVSVYAGVRGGVYDGQRVINYSFGT